MSDLMPDPPADEQEESEQRDDAIVEAEEGKGYGADEGERDEALPE